jgi:hypothetical protein
MLYMSMLVGISNPIPPPPTILSPPSPRKRGGGTCGVSIEWERVAGGRRLRDTLAFKAAEIRLP